MAKALLILPHFWDPVCVPLGISSLKAHAELAGHEVSLFDFNTVPEVFDAQRSYFSEGKQQFPFWRKWNIERNGTEMLALHQLVYLHARTRPHYRELVAEVLNMSGLPIEVVMDQLNVDRFDAIFSALFARVSIILERLLEKTRPDVLGCSLFNSTWPGTLFILRRAKGFIPHLRTVVGGPGPIMGITSDAEEIRSFYEAHDFINYLVIGEGEQPFVRILDTPNLPAGILSASANLTLNIAKNTATPLELLPLPDYGTLQVDRYIHLSLASSRGCPFECSFCAETVFWQGFRMIEHDALFERLNSLALRYGRKSFYLCDSLSNQAITPLTNAITAHNKRYSLDCYLRPDPLCADEARTKRWRQGGLVRARLGMESASQRILDAMYKMTSPETMSRSLWSLGRQGIMTSTLWILCYPGETEADFETTLRFIREHRSCIYQADAWLFQYHPNGLAHSNEITDEHGSRKRFSSELNQIFAVAPYLVDRGCSSEERFNRLERFVLEMERLQIPNPYSLVEWRTANQRWDSLDHVSGASSLSVWLNS